MRILDEDADKAINRVTLYLTSSEAAELRDSLEGLLTGAADSHAHVSNQDYSKEVTVCVYDPAADLGAFNQRSRRLIQEDR